MALHLVGQPAHVIRKMGRWKSDAFLCYLHAQMSCFSKGLSSLMSAVHPFTNVARPPTSTETILADSPAVAPARLKQPEPSPSRGWATVPFTLHSHGTSGGAEPDQKALIRDQIWLPSEPNFRKLN